MNIKASDEGSVADDSLFALGLCENQNAVLEFPRISKEHEADALLNGVGTLN